LYDIKFFIILLFLYYLLFIISLFSISSNKNAKLFQLT